MHADIDDLLIYGYYVEIIKNLEIRIGYIKEEHEKDPNTVSSYADVFDENKNYMRNYLNGVFFDSYEQGLKTLTKILSSRYEFNNIQNTLCDKLIEKYPEAIV